MKKMIFGLCALLACFVMSSCGGSPESKIKDIEGLTEKAKDCKSASEAVDIMTDFMEASIDFYKGDPTVEQAAEYAKKASAFEEAFAKAAMGLDKEELEKLEKDKSAEEKVEKLQKEFKKVVEEWEKKHKDDKKDAKEDKDEEEDED